MNISQGRDPKDVFYEFINSSVISYVGAGSSGLGLLSSNPTNDSYKILTTNNENVVCSQMFIKIVPIYADKSFQPQFDLHIRKMDHWADIFSSEESEFWNEVRIQNEIYKKTNDNLEPICPPIVFSECLDNATSTALLDMLFDNLDKSDIPADLFRVMMADDPLNKIATKLKLPRYHRIKLGIIGMGFTKGYQSLHSVVRGKDAAEKQPYLDLAIYELLRLYSIGYLHGDFSQENIMVNPTYNYTGTNSGRAMIIDFGMTFKHNEPDVDILRILERMRDTRVPFIGIAPTQHRNYNWFINYINTYRTRLVDSLNALRQSVLDHSTAMIHMIRTTYPDLLAQIRAYNKTIGLENIFHGGFKNASQIEDVITPAYIQHNMLDVKNVPMYKPVSKSKSNTLSMIEFNDIFNPNNLDIPQLLDAYLRTLNLGEKSIKEGIKGLTGKMGGKKQKRSLRNRKRNHKQKTKRRQVYRSKKTYRRR
jgi:hypothetical protein